MSDEPPTPPASFSTEVIDALNNLSPNSLRDVARYARGLVEREERKAHREEEPPGEELEEWPNDPPDDVPTKATITIKEVSDKRYYCWQQREGGEIKSKCKGPVNSGEQKGQLP